MFWVALALGCAALVAGTLWMLITVRQARRQRAWRRYRRWYRGYQVHTLAWTLVKRWRSRPMLAYRSHNLPALVQRRSTVFRLALWRRRGAQPTSGSIATH